MRRMRYIECMRKGTIRRIATEARTSISVTPPVLDRLRDLRYEVRGTIQDVIQALLSVWDSMSTAEQAAAILRSKQASERRTRKQPQTATRRRRSRTA